MGNVIHQIQKLLEEPAEKIHGKTFYWSDYNGFTIRQWANTLSKRIRGIDLMTIPDAVIKFAALSGDVLKKTGVQSVRMTSFRLNNMRADTAGIPLKAMKDGSGDLPYSMEQGVDLTVRWLEEYRII